MREDMLELLRCPVTRSRLQLQVIARSHKVYNGVQVEVIEEGILFADNDWVYPIVKGIPRLLVEAFLDYAGFLKKHLPDYTQRKEQLEKRYHGLIKYVLKKNSHTKRSFSQEWGIFEYGSTRTWDADDTDMLERFLKETGESRESLRGKLIFDAGCGNGRLNQFIAGCGAIVLGMDFSNSIERAWQQNTQPNALFIQGDVQFPPVEFARFDIVHCSGVLICTNNTELSFSCIDPCVRPGGKLSVWLYHPRKDAIHNLFNFTRRFTSKLPIRLQYYLYAVTVFPPSYIIKRLKGNKQNTREMMIDILDWLSPEFRWEHEDNEAASWFHKRSYAAVQVTTRDTFGFNITGKKITMAS
jgi:2-polyprenyl-3-methyl-5-hydroxy-6-metoxy-1,4-benzoquinol methylase/uncharacterized protein YbaR (Trm112 family)